MDEDYKTLDVIPSYLNPKVLVDIARYYGNNIYKEKTWTEYMKKELPK